MLRFRENLMLTKVKTTENRMFPLKKFAIDKR